MRNLSPLLFLPLVLVSCFERLPENHANEFMHKSSFEELVKRFNDPKRAEWQKVDEVIAFMKVQEEDVIADIGAGTGYFTFPIAEHCERVIAIDIDTGFVNYLNQQKAKHRVGNVEIRLSEEEEPELDERECDKIIIVNTVHHFQKVAKYLSKARKCLRIGGSLVIVDWKAGDLPHGPPDEYKLPLNELKRQLGMAGFRSLDVDTTTLPYQYMVRAY